MASLILSLVKRHFGVSNTPPVAAAFFNQSLPNECETVASIAFLNATSKQLITTALE
jgi:hypothetical protein